MSWNTNIQWKGTDVCIDIICPKCGNQDHIDGDFLYYVRCESCKTTYKLGTEVSLAECDDCWENCTHSLYVEDSMTEEQFQEFHIRTHVRRFQQSMKALLEAGVTMEMLSKL